MRPSLLLLCACAAGCFTLSLPADKHACERDDDCVGNRVCQDNVCHMPPELDGEIKQPEEAGGEDAEPTIDADGMIVEASVASGDAGAQDAAVLDARAQDAAVLDARAPDGSDATSTDAAAALDAGPSDATAADGASP